MTTTRRSFVTSGAAALLGSFGGPAVLAQRADYDLVIRGGTLFDGTGAEGRIVDLAVANGRIAAVGSRVARGREEIDARGLAVAPGFIDIHSHGDGTLGEDPRAESVVRQGITTIVAGADGSSRASGADDKSFADLFLSLDRLKPAVNVASMIGLGTVRGAVIGDRGRSATATELARMTAMVESAIADGACGASSGLEYTPGAFASRDELITLCRPLAPRRLPYATHMRNEDDRLLDAIDESLAVARGAGCALQISHLKTQGPRNWPKLDQVFNRIEASRSAGVDVAFDRYPYTAYSTGLTNLFPVWSRDGGVDAFLGRLAATATGPRIRQEALAKVDLIGGWDNVLVSSVRAVADRNAEGKRLGAYARDRGADPYELAVGLLRQSRGDVGMLGFAMSEENLERILKHPLGMVCTDGVAFAIDGPTRRGSPHPRSAGSFPRVLARYVRERKVLSLPEAIRKMTSLPASRVRLNDRGRLVVGLAADVVAFDPARIADTATFEAPFQYPAGIAAVVVNGVAALRDGQRSAIGSGRALRAG
ncbi:MAG: amidohydrolase family protein [Gemmatimonadaceae bacterium]|nr:amidohydrolase family protein [Gemmatimonadaceae bacterium]